MKIFTREPAVIVGLVQSLLALAVAFGFNLSGDQVGAILAVTSAILALVLRDVVVSPATLVEKVGEIPASAIGGLAGKLVRKGA